MIICLHMPLIGVLVNSYPRDLNLSPYDHQKRDPYDHLSPLSDLQVLSVRRGRGGAELAQQPEQDQCLRRSYSTVNIKNKESLLE